MSGPETPGTPPPEVSEEFAAAYREAFERALAQGQHPAGAHLAGVEAVEEAEEAAEDSGDPGDAGDERDPALDRTDEEPVVVVPPDVQRVTEYRAATPAERIRESPAFVPGIVALLALILIGGAYGVGTLFSAAVDGGAPTGEHTAPSSSQGSLSGSPTGQKSHKPGSPKAAKPWKGKVAAVKISSVKVSCTLPPGRNASGGKVTYQAANMLDGEPRTAWRCGGEAIGQKLVVNLPGGTKVAQVGLVPGYAKTDRRSGVDRYAENNRITKVRWGLGDGRSVVQELDGAAGHRGMQTLRVPPTTTGQVTLEILDVVRGSRNTTAISELRIAKPR